MVNNFSLLRGKIERRWALLRRMLKTFIDRRLSPCIRLTDASRPGGEPAGGIDVIISELIAYDQQEGFTRLRLVGRRILEVKETTQEIDSLIRRSDAAAGCEIPTGDEP